MARSTLSRRGRLLAPLSLIVLAACGGTDDTTPASEPAPTGSTASTPASGELVGSGADSAGAVVLGVDPAVGAALDAANDRVLAALEASLTTVVVP